MIFDRNPELWNLPMDENAVRTVSRLRDGETYCRAIFFNAEEFSPELPNKIRAAKLKLKRDMSPVVARAKKAVNGSFRLYTLHSLTTDYEVVVLGVIVRDPDL